MNEKQEYIFKEEFLENTEQTEKGENKSSRAEGCLEFVFIQSVACVMIVLTALLLKAVAPKTYSQIKSGYTAATTQEDITFEDIKNMFSWLGKFLFSVENKQVSSSSSGVSQNESSSSSQNESSSLSDSESGAGGEDSKTLPDTVTTSAYLLTTSISAPAKGTVTSEFGWRIHPITKTEGFHTGLDIANALGTPITAALSGTIYECGNNEAYGNYILMRHSDNLYTFYGHCDSLKAEKGMNIRRGEVIAYMGSTGYSTGPHLHFEIRIDGKRVDPAYVLQGIEGIEF